MAQNPNMQTKAIYNEGWIQAKRVGEAQENINKIRANLTAFNVENNCYNYELWIAHLESLLHEIAKMNDDDYKKLIEIQNVVEDFLFKLPPHKNVVKEGSGQRIVVFKRDNWVKLKKLVEIFERAVKKNLDSYGLGNPDIEGEALF